MEGSISELTTHISSLQSELSALESAIDSLASTEIYDNFNVGSDVEMLDHVSVYLPELTTESQKLAVVIGLQ